MFKKRKLFKILRREKFNEYLFKDNVMMIHKLTANLTNNADRMEERMNEKVKGIPVRGNDNSAL